MTCKQSEILMTLV